MHGPLLAIMYLNDLAKQTHNDALFYADDTSLYSSHLHDNLGDKQSIQNDLDTIRRYGQDWAITFNTQKTVPLQFDGQHIPTMTQHKHLGLILSTDLHFHDHVNSIIRTVNMLLGPIYPVAKFLSRSILNNICIYDIHQTALRLL